MSNNVHPIFQGILDRHFAAVKRANGRFLCQDCGDEPGRREECEICGGSGLEPVPTMETLPAYVRRLIEADAIAIERKPNTFAELPVDEQLVASIAVANYRKGNQ